MKVQSSSIDYKESHRILNVDNDIFVGQVAVTAFDKKAIYEFYCAVHLANRFGEADHARFDEFEMGIVK